MRIGVLMSVASPWSRQAALQVRALGHEVMVFDLGGHRLSSGYLSHNDTFQMKSIFQFEGGVSEVQYFNRRHSMIGSIASAAYHISRLCREHDIDSLLSLYAGSQAAAAYLSRVRPYYVYTVGSDVLMVSGLRKRFTRIVLESATHVFANGRYLAERTKALAPNARVDCIYLGIDPDRFCTTRESPDTVQITCTRGFLPVYNNEYLVHALGEIANVQLNYEVVFTAAGPMLEDVRRLADRLLPPAVRSRVSFLGGITDDQMLETLRRSHVYVSLSRSDGTSTSLLEAMASGLFPVVSDIPQNREWICPEEGNGILVPMDQPGILGSMLIRAIEDPSLRTRASAHNRQLIRDRANSRETMKSMMSCIEDGYRTYPGGVVRAR